MTPRVCSREADVLHLVTIGQWPRQAGAELVSHVSGCDACHDVFLVASALREIDDDLAAAPGLPEAGAVWQRAQWQARQDAMARAARPVVAVQGIAALGVLAMIAVGIIWLASSVVATGGLTDLTYGVQAFAASTSAMASLLAVDVSPRVMWTVAAAVGVGTTVIGVAIGLSMLADLHSDPPARP